MKDLKCGLKECRYNKGYSCLAECITVNEQTDCKSFDPMQNKSNNMFEAAGDFVPADFSVDTKVTCGADCVFNKQGDCVANGITVMSDASQDAMCLTFVKK